MAMDRNAKLVLFKKVPKLNEDDLPSLDDQIYFVETQIEERRKIVMRNNVTVEEARIWVDLDDKDAVQAAENAVVQSVAQTKGVLLELAALRKILGALKAQQRAASKA